MEKNNQSVKPVARRSIGASKRQTVDGIATHCGFIETAGLFWTFHPTIVTACDNFFADRGMVWVPQIQDYLTPDVAEALTRVLS